ncbi:nose resistant to fluoxetine protein 6-like [Anabrus simplex]|uniref:nose resistant to fluoxetine protein 6-like n=1 Tax=Anabrus simplex TaxID=316456 RepID=UPI0035A3D533
MVVDYSRTINQYTELDAYPLPRTEDIVNKVANYEVFSSVDLKNAYHQIPIYEEDRPYTAFEACGKLWQYKRIPFGPTNGVPCFQRTIDTIIKNERLNGVTAYLDDIIVGGKTKEEHDFNLKKFLKAVQKYEFTINEKKSVYSVKTIKLLGYIISNHEIRPDPDRLAPLQELPLPTDTASLRRAMGMFAHFANFIPRFSQKIHNLLSGSRSELYVVFSAYTNLKKLMSTSETSGKNLGCLHGIRFFSIAYVVLGHTYICYGLIPLHNNIEVNEFLKSLNSTWVMTGVFSVDTFFLLSGLLLCYGFFNTMTEKKSINYKAFYMHRFMRLTPTLLAVLLIQASLVNKLNTGPMWNHIFVEDCSDRWWQVLFYIKNYYYTNPCMLHTWYVSADTQLYCLSPLLLITLWKNPRLGKKLLALGLFLGWFIPFTYAYVWEIPCPITPFVFVGNKVKESAHLYNSTETRFAPWLMGIWLGYIMHRIKAGQLTVKMNKAVVVVLWLYVIIVALSCALSVHSYMLTTHVYRRFEDSLYNSTIRILWTSAVGLTILACTTGYGGPFNNMLSHRWWAPWSRLTYAIYLVHLIILRVTTAQLRVPQNLNHVAALRSVISVLMMSALAAVLLNLMLESPVSALEKILMREPNKYAALKSSTDGSEDVEKKGRMQNGYIKLPISEPES